ncbi:MAG: flavin reductase family protein [Planctomycetota bacterium]|nr:flavin reductase family protein [Planctomycetota bacterium]
MPGAREWSSFDAAELGVAERYKYLIGGIVPRPIAVVGTRSSAGVANLAPFSFFAGVGSTPWTLLFCPANRDAPGGPEKDTLANAKPVEEGGTGVFCVSVASEGIIRQVVAASEPLPPGQDEFAAVGLTPVECDRIGAPRVAESPLAFECRTLSVTRLAKGVPGGANIVVGEVVRVHAHSTVWLERHRIDPAALQAVGRMGGLSYCTTAARFELPMGLAALASGG